MQPPWPVGVALILVGLTLAIGNRLVQADVRRSPGGTWMRRHARGMQADAQGRNVAVIGVGTMFVLVGVLLLVAALTAGRSTGPVLDSLVVDGERFDVLSRDGGEVDSSAYTICTATAPRSCGQLPTLEQYTSVAVPTAHGGAVLFIGRDGTLGPLPGDRLAVRIEGSEGPSSEPDVTYLRTPLLDYGIAAVRMPRFAPLFCVSVLRAGLGRNTIALAGVENPPGNCADG